MEGDSRTAFTALGVLATAAVPLPFAPFGDGLVVAGYLLVACLTLTIGLVGAGRRPPAERAAWRLLLLGMVSWFLGDVVSALRSFDGDVLVLRAEGRPEHALYLAGYLLMAQGLHRLVARYQTVDDDSGVLDALIIAVATSIVVAVFVYAPLASNSGLSVWDKVVWGMYPAGDLLLLALLVRLWTVDGQRTPAFHMLVASVATALAADASWTYSIMVQGSTRPENWIGGLWLVCYILTAAAVWARVSDNPRPSRPDHPPAAAAATLRRVAPLGAGMALPGLALLVDGANGGPVRWQIICIGSLVLSGLVLARMTGLLSKVELQRSALEKLARSDALTGAPNRRTWDFELARAAAAARQTGSPLSVALLDLDGFKDFNDAHGHQAGDTLLREVVTAWTRAVEGRGKLARYGGDEFALLLPGQTAEEGAELVRALHDVTPAGRTFSAGVAAWDPATDPTTAFALADAAMYDAKRSGRDRVVIARSDITLPRVR